MSRKLSLAWLVLSAVVAACGGGGGGGGGGTPQYTLTLSKTGAGGGSVSGTGISCGADCTETYSAGTAVTLTATPDGTSTFAGWSGGGCSGTGTCTLTIDADVTVTAQFDAVATWPLTVTKTGTGGGTVTGTGISCGADCAETVADGTVVTLTATPDAISTFAGWSGGGCSGTGTCTVTVGGATTVTAQFDLVSRTLTVSKSGTGGGTVTSAPVGISCGSTCSAAWDHGTAVTLSAVADATSTFTGWSGSGCSGTGTCVLDMASDQAVTATFTRQTRTLTVTMSGGSSTLVSSNPAGLSCYGGTCTATFDVGAAVALTASSPMSDSAFVSWSGACSGTDPATCSVTMDADRSVTATFGLLRTLAVTATGDGNVTSSVGGIDCGTGGSACAAQLLDGTAVTLTAAPGAGQMVQWGGDCAGSTGLTCALTMSAVRSASATFLAARTLTVAKSGTGTGTVSSSPSGISCGIDCSEVWPDGAAVMLTATPDASALFTGWGGDCAASGTSTTCWITMSADRSVSAGFTPKRTLTVSFASGGHVWSTPSGIDCWGSSGGGTCTATFSDGANVDLTAAPSANFELTAWSGGGCSGAGACTVAMTADVTVTVTFTEVRTLTVGLGADGGTVTSDTGGLSCPGTCSVKVPVGTDVTLTAASYPGWAFTSWGSDCSGTSATCTVTLSADRTVWAYFDGPFDFAVSQPWVPDLPLSLLPGESRTVPVSVGVTRGSGLPVDLTITGLPAGVTGAFSPTTVTPPATSVLTLTAAAGAAATTMPFPEATITGTNGTTVRTAILDVEVRSAKGLRLPNGVVIEPGGATALVAEEAPWGYGTSHIVRVDVARRLATKTIASGMVHPAPTPSELGTAHAMALADGGATLWVAHAGGLSRIDVATGVVTNVSPIDQLNPTTALTRPWGLALLDANTAVVSDCGSDYGGCSTGRVVKVNLATGAVTEIPLGIGMKDVRGVALEPGGLTGLVVELGNNLVRRFWLEDGANQVLTGSIGWPSGIAIEEGGVSALVSGGGGFGWGGGYVYRVDLTSGVFTPILATNSGGHLGVAPEAGGATALVTQYGPGLLLRTSTAYPVGWVAPAYASVYALDEAWGVALDATAANAYVTACVDTDCNAKSELVKVALTGAGAGQVTQLVTGLAQLKGVVVEPPGLTALVAVDQPGAAKLLRVTFADKTVQTVAQWGGSDGGAADVALEAGATTALVNVGTRLYRVPLDVPVPATPVLVADLTCGASYNATFGIAVEAAGKTLVTRVCGFASGPRSYLLRVDETAGPATTTVVSEGFAGLVDVEMGPAGVAYVAEGSGSAEGRVIAVDLATGDFAVVSSQVSTPRYLARKATGELFVTTRDLVNKGRLAELPAAPPWVPIARFHGFDRPAGFALEAGEASAIVASCGATDCRSSGVLTRVDWSAGRTATTIFPAGTLNFEWGGGFLALEDAANLLVTDCGTGSDCSTGRVLRIQDSGGWSVAGAPLASGLNQPAGIAIEDATWALVVERGAGRLVRVRRTGGGVTSIRASGLSYPRFVVPEVPGSTALVVTEYSGYAAVSKLQRVDLTVTSNNVTTVAELDLAAVAVEPALTAAGDRTALAIGSAPGYPTLQWSLYRVNLDTGGIDVLAPAHFRYAQGFALNAAGTSAFYTERRHPSTSNQGEPFLELPLP